jgi:hypothetical protein
MAAYPGNCLFGWCDLPGYKVGEGEKSWISAETRLLIYFIVGSNLQNTLIKKCRFFPIRRMSAMLKPKPLLFAGFNGIKILRRYLNGGGMVIPAYKRRLCIIFFIGINSCSDYKNDLLIKCVNRIH